MNILHAINGVFQSSAITAAAWGIASSFVLCVLLVLTKRWHGVWSMDFSDGIQKFHTAPTPRVGGIPIVMSLGIAWTQAPANVQAMLTPILIAGMPAFLFGVAEDISKRISVMLRLLATMASGLLAWWITDYSLTRVDIWGVDWFMQFTLVSVIFTAFAVGGVANSINIIDGFNGLASTMSTLAFMGYAMIAWQVGDTTLASVSLLLAACVWGFFWVNWPFGKLFLGDGGSYFIGFGLAWVAVLLLERNPSVSAFAALVICVHPVTEVLFSIYRRKVKKANPGHPDRLHFHSLVKRRYVARWFSQYPACTGNSITGVLIGFMTLMAIVLANLSYASTAVSALVFVGLGLGYVAIYARMVRHSWCSPLEFLLVKRPPSIRLLK
ncbi:glycosyltransferase [Limnohabitans sp. DM1]|uniref:MraY family glycosyltransferase n=1 Tax=Limnohabitans sp. DM1 TaxID=1597955 RepID=UPI001892A828|nr:glycosyltransferase [Limnohabitans sp. DM1]